MLGKQLTSNITFQSRGQVLAPGSLFFNYSKKCYILLMFQNFLLRKMLRTQDVPENQIEMFLKMLEKNPELFKNIAEEIKKKTDAGMDQKTASLGVMKKYEEELKKLA